MWVRPKRESNPPENAKYFSVLKHVMAKTEWLAWPSKSA
jgi:hypothetical protein